MAKFKYQTAPVKTDKYPPGIPFIIGNEIAERFCYYGINTILLVFMTHNLLDRSGQAAPMNDHDAEGWCHTFAAAVYFLPILGALLADAILGKYLTILSLSVVYCIGNLALAVNHTRLGLALGLALIALGAGGIKPCVSANVGDQFGASNEHLLARMFTWFYLAINLGSAFSTFLTPILLDVYGPAVAFGTPGVFMLLATVVFWMGRKKFVHIQPAKPGPYLREMFQREHLKAMLNLLILVPFATVYWSLWNQNFYGWVVQAEHMNRHVLGHDLLPSQVQVVNPVFVLCFLPIFSYVVYPLAGRFFKVTPLRKFGAGLFANALAFFVVWLAQTWIDAGQKPSVWWQVLAFVPLTCGEVLLSVTHLEFSYTQAPKKMKSLVMCLYLGSIAAGNELAATVNFMIEKGTLHLPGASYYAFFLKIMLVTAVVFIVVAQFYRGKTYIQDEGEAQTV
jgi:proton-dependent oligopeptide transporter, POT family